MIPGAKPIPPLTPQMDTTMVTKVMTPNKAAQMNLEDQVASMDQEDQVALVVPVALVVLEVPMVPEVQAGLATTLPMSKTSYGNS